MEKYSTKGTILCQEIGMISQTFPSKFSHIPFQVEQLLEINSSHVQSTMLVNSNSFTVCGENFVLAVDQDWMVDLILVQVLLNIWKELRWDQMRSDSEVALIAYGAGIVGY